MITILEVKGNTTRTQVAAVTRVSQLERYAQMREKAFAESVRPRTVKHIDSSISRWSTYAKLSVLGT